MVAGSDDGQSWPLRRGGAVTVVDDALRIDRDGEDTIHIELDNVMEVTQRSVDWFTGILSVILVGIGLYLTQEHLVGGLVFAAAGAVSVYITYRRRDETNLRVQGRTKPVTVYPENGQRFYADLGRLLEVEDARSEGEDTS